jgi:hypothetical protein
MRESRRGTLGPDNARPGQQAPRSGWQGARREDATEAHIARPGDPIVVARVLAEGEPP